PGETCSDTRAVPVIAFHGTADAIVPFAGGPGGIPGFQTNFRLPIDDATPAEDVMSDWAQHDGCASGRQESQVSNQVRLIRYETCTDGAVVDLYAVDGGGHTWPDAVDIPGLGKTTHEINATDLMWTFFQAHPMGAPKAVGGIAELAPAAGAPAQAPGPAGGSVALMAGGAAFVASGAIGAGWWLRRRLRSRRGTPGTGARH
ncbi:MAG: hypothetical protein Q8S13_04635, partial [Dehalococcoidia bacterium]|nr:hypothetical protein [Dehalococcoidia bacterium]